MRHLGEPAPHHVLAARRRRQRRIERVGLVVVVLVWALVIWLGLNQAMG